MDDSKTFMPKQGIAGTVILFQPEERSFDFILSYLDLLDVLYIVDNTENPAVLPASLQSDPRVVYLPQGMNKGQAAALNLAARRALADGYSWLLTMDQDSSFEKAHRDAYVRAFEAFEGREKCALFSPSHRRGLPAAAENPESYSEPDTLMTSGNLLNLKVFSVLGGFEEDLFIDTVDHDYCLRARMAGFRLIRFDAVRLAHEVGKGLWLDLKGRRVRITTHPPERMYTITRNNFRLWQKYYRHFPAYIQSRIRHYFLETLRNIFFYERQKRIKLQYAFLGAWDFLSGRYGRTPQMLREGKPHGRR